MQNSHKLIGKYNQIPNEHFYVLIDCFYCFYLYKPQHLIDLVGWGVLETSLSKTTALFIYFAFESVSLLDICRPPIKDP